jgi:hypothetical protein
MLHNSLPKDLHVHSLLLKPETVMNILHLVLICMKRPRSLTKRRKSLCKLDAKQYFM